MATSFNFGGKSITLAGAYSRIVSGRNNPPQDLDFGKVLIIDINGDIAGGAGINGEHASGKDAIYSFSDLSTFRDFSFSGVWWRAAQYLFTPNGQSIGASSVSVIKPFTTVASSMTFTAVGSATNGGTFKFDTLDEGTGANGVLEGSDLKSGYAFTIETGEVDTSKWIFKVWRGNYKGDSTGLITPALSFDEIELASNLANPALIAQSPEFDNIQNLIDWANDSESFASYFKLDATSAIAGDGSIDAADVSGVSGFNLSVGGTQVANATDLNDALDTITDLNYNFIIAWDNGAKPEASTDVLKVKTFVETQSDFNPQLHVTDQIGDEDSISNAVTTTSALDSDKVVYTFGSIKKTSQLSNTNLVDMHPIFHLAFHVGRLAGLEPQVPLTFKSIDINGLVKQLNRKEQEQLLNAGVLCTTFNTLINDFVVLQDVNTLQNNKYTLNQDGTSHVIQYRRIAAQLNAELKVNATRNLLSNPTGTNRNTLSESDIKDFVQGYLQRKIATDLQDNLILSYKNVTVKRDQDAYFVTYEFVPNDEIRLIFFTGFAL